MADWGEVLVEIQEDAAKSGGRVDVDKIRLKYLTRLHALTGRSVISYSTDYLSKGGQQASIVLGDMIGMMEALQDRPGPNLDIILHSPGGHAEATDRIVRYVRSKFSHVRIFVPLAAMSAATMWCMSADEIVMGKHSQLGPIDPQITLPSTGIPMPAGALIDQFQAALQECADDPRMVTGWLPTLQQYPPGLLSYCQSVTKLAQELVAEWLSDFMFAWERNRKVKAKRVAAWLADDKTHLSHLRGITRDALRAKGLKIIDLEKQPDLQDAVLSVHHATIHTLSGTAIKLIENHMGKRYVQHHGSTVMATPPSAPATP